MRSWGCVCSVIQQTLIESLFWTLGRTSKQNSLPSRSGYSSWEGRQRANTTMSGGEHQAEESKARWGRRGSPEEGAYSRRSISLWVFSQAPLSARNTLSTFIFNLYYKCRSGPLPSESPLSRRLDDKFHFPTPSAHAHPPSAVFTVHGNSPFTSLPP